MIRLPPSPTHDPWSSFDDEPIPPIQAGPSRPRNGSASSSRPSSPNSVQRHPLHPADTKPDIDTRALAQNGRYPGLDVLSDVSRPALRRFTSETERQVAESSRSGSERGSLDLLRMSVADPGAEEVEVLIHHVSVRYVTRCRRWGDWLMRIGEAGGVDSWYSTALWYRCKSPPQFRARKRLARGQMLMCRSLRCARSTSYGHPTRFIFEHTSTSLWKLVNGQKHATHSLEGQGTDKSL